MSEIAKIEGVDYVYDSDNWEVTHEVEDIDMLTDDGPTDNIVTVETLISGPTYYAFRARFGSTRIFTTYEECKAASDAALVAENAADDPATPEPPHA